MDYKLTKELEENIKIKNEAEKIYSSFLRNVKLSVSKYKGDGRFIIASDTYNTTYVRIKDDKFILECRFLHESYDVTVTPEEIFRLLKEKYRGVEHLGSYANGKY